MAPAIVESRQKIKRSKLYELLRKDADEDYSILYVELRRRFKYIDHLDVLRIGGAV